MVYMSEEAVIEDGGTTIKRDKQSLKETHKAIYKATSIMVLIRDTSRVVKRLPSSEF